jgi:hypothetical protein
LTEYFRDLVSGGLPSPDPYHRAPGRLYVNDILFSATRNFKLTLQPDGNLVLYVIDDSTLRSTLLKANTHMPSSWGILTELGVRTKYDSLIPRHVRQFTDANTATALTRLGHHAVRGAGDGSG